MKLSFPKKNIMKKKVSICIMKYINNDNNNNFDLAYTYRFKIYVL